MKPLKPIDYAIIFELLKDSNRADRPIAKVLGVLQPTFIRRKAVFEKRIIEGYTVSPKFGEIDFEVAALTFMKIRAERKTAAEQEAMFRKMRAWFKKQPSLVAHEDHGMDGDHVCVSMHRSFTGYAEFARTLEKDHAYVLAPSGAFFVT